jgi:hypothetical protein
MNSFTNVIFDEIEIGKTLTVSRTISRHDIESLTFVSGDIDEAHLDEEKGPDYVPSTEPVADEAFLSYFLNCRLPGLGTTILAHALTFEGRITMDDSLAATISAKERLGGATDGPDGGILECPSEILR